MCQNTAVLKVSENSQWDVFSRVLFKQFELSNLPAIPILKTDSTGNVSCECSKNFENCFRSSHQRCSIKKVFLEISQNSQENTCARIFGKNVSQNTSGRLLLQLSAVLIKDFFWKFIYYIIFNCRSLTKSSLIIEDLFWRSSGMS